MTGITRQEQKQLTRQKIINTAFRLYSSKGFSTATKVIAQEAGISHGSIFVHFPTSEALQFHVLKHFSQEVGDKLHNLSVEDRDISELLHGHIRLLEQYESFYKNMLAELAALPQETKMLLISLQSTMSSHFAIVIEKERKKEKIKDVPLHMLFNTWVGLLHYYLQNSDLFSPGASVLKRYGDELVDTFVALISK